MEDNTHIKVVALPKEKNAANVAKWITSRKSVAAKQEKHPNKDTTRSKRPVHPLKDSTPANESDSDSEGYLYNVRTNKTPVVWVKVRKHLFDATIDTGATLNVIDRQTYEKMDGVHLRKTKVKAFAYTAEEPVKFIGKFEAVVETWKRVAVTTFHVAEKPDSGNLISEIQLKSLD